jgi:hypothetical protein
VALIDVREGVRQEAAVRAVALADVDRELEAGPTTMLAAAYATASPTRSTSSMRRSSTCIVENVVSAPHTPVSRNGRR